MRVFLACLIVIGACSCIDRIPSRVQVANRGVISFLVKYCKSQAISRDAVHAYDTQLRPGSDTGNWRSIAADYENLRSVRYVCRFDIKVTSFAVTCSPDPLSGLHISFYVDDRRRITLSGSGTAGPSSPELRLTRKEELELRGRYE